MEPAAELLDLEIIEVLEAILEALKGSHQIEGYSTIQWELIKGVRDKLDVLKEKAR